MLDVAPHKRVQDYATARTMRDSAYGEKVCWRATLARAWLKRARVAGPSGGGANEWKGNSGSSAGGA